MSKSRLEIKVGLFALFGLVLLATLMIWFTKGVTFFRGTYLLHMHATDVGGIKPRASVLMSGVQVGTVAEIILAPDGRSVTIDLKIYQNYVLYTNAEFAIEASGFLGDQYVAIKPSKIASKPLQNGDDVTCEEPLNIQEVARSAVGFIHRVDDAARKLDDTIADVRRLVLNQENLTNLSATIHSVRVAADRAHNAMDEVNGLLLTNRAAVSYAVSNIVQFSDDLNHFSSSLNDLMATNRTGINAAVSNIESSSAVLREILEDAHDGKGLAGTLLHNEEVASKAGEIVNNLSITSSNLNRLGLWRVLFPRHPREASESSGRATVGSPKALAN